MEPGQEPVRVDRWLWAARLYKTRPIAAEAVAGGLVRVAGRRVKPSREVHPGDEVETTRGDVRMTVVVRATASRRGPAKEAALLYDETAGSAERRERQAAERRLSAATPASGPRPTKRDRRRMDATRSRR